MTDQPTTPPKLTRPKAARVALGAAAAAVGLGLMFLFTHHLAARSGAHDEAEPGAPPECGSAEGVQLATTAFQEDNDQKLDFGRPTEEYFDRKGNVRYCSWDVANSVMTSNWIYKILLGPSGKPMIRIGAFRLFASEIADLKARDTAPAVAAPTMTSSDTAGGGDTPRVGPVPAAGGKALEWSNLIGQQQTQIDALVGPAVSSGGSMLTYEHDGCKVRVYYKADHTAYALGLDAGAACTDRILTSFNVLNDIPPSGSMTFGGLVDAISNGSDTSYATSCLSQCGAGSRVTDYLYFNGPHALDFIQLELRAGGASDRPDELSAADPRAKAWEGGRASISCNDDFDAMAAKAMRQVKVSYIVVGYDFLDHRCDHKSGPGA
ncbi:MAG TPA: hypothetical protein VG407_07025 [Caulobacteraceae bacterium]|jgi:hypothetical protein|nr:hypothetical protein [Caulobacteraceae bacterium]